jgi:hypothetical protein
MNEYVKKRLKIFETWLLITALWCNFMIFIALACVTVHIWALVAYIIIAILSGAYSIYLVVKIFKYLFKETII